MLRDTREGAFPLTRIVSGGQTGVDRGALDAALARGFPCGGWCPAGRLAEDGPIPESYPVIELAGAGYPERTRQNVLDSDGTLVIFFGHLGGGTANTARLCEHHKKPVLVLDGLDIGPREVANAAAKFVAAHGIRTLNVAGPRESGYDGARGFAEVAVDILLEQAVVRVA